MYPYTQTLSIVTDVWARVCVCVGVQKQKGDCYEEEDVETGEVVLCIYVRDL